MTLSRKSPCGCNDTSSEAPSFPERATFERELFELQASPPPICDHVPTKCYDATAKSVPPALGLEFDTTVGSSTSAPPPSSADYSLDGCRITTHTAGADGFRCEGDGNRIEMKMHHVPISDGKAKLSARVGKIVDFVALLQKTCKAKKWATAPKKGEPRWFVPPKASAGVASVFPISRGEKPYYVDCDYEISAAPQATLTLPLSAVDNLVDEICRSEAKKVPGRAWSGPKTRGGKKLREGVRSRALYEAQLAVNKSRAAHVKANKTLSDKKTVVDATTFSRSLQGLMILMVSYLRVNFVPYGARDYEQIAKSYLPLNVKNHFRLLYADLSAAEKRVFKELYADTPVNLWKLAKPAATATDGDNELLVVDFTNAKGNQVTTRDHQACYFDPPLTWKDFLRKIVDNEANKRTVDPKSASSKCGFGSSTEPYGKSGEDLDCEVLFSPLSRVIEYEPKSLRVTVEMRRLGHGFVYAHPNKKTRRPGWLEMAEGLFDLTERMNDPKLPPVKKYCAATWS